MMKNIFGLLFISFTLFINAQITYEKGYFIDNDNNRTECYIKNIDWRTSPNQISYRSTLEAKTQEASMLDIKEFYIYNTEHYYKRFNLSIDESIISDFSSNSRDLNYNDKTTFLRVLVDGDANLYEYPGSGIFFFNEDNENVKQLEYKSYVNEQSIKKENNDFRRQLFENLKCEAISLEKMLKVDYTRKKLIKVFSDYNTCKNSEYKLYQINKTKTKINLSLSFGVVNKSLDVDYSVNTLESSDNFGSQTVFSPGFDLELLLPFNKNKWALFVAPNYQYYNKSTRPVSLFSEDLGEISFEYSYIEIPAGIRYYMYLNSNSKLYAQLAYGAITHISNNNEEPFEKNDQIQGEIFFEEEGSANSIFTIGFGYKYKDKFGLILNYYASKKIANNSNFASSMDGAISLLATYTLF